VVGAERRRFVHDRLELAGRQVRESEQPVSHISHLVG
jgi:hypothetical protein